MKYSRVVDEQAALSRWLESNFGQGYIRAFCLPETGDGLSRGDAAVIYKRALRLVATTATPYFWSPAMCEQLERVEVSEDWRLQPEHLPTRHGFCWFERPMPMPRATWEDGTESDDPVVAVFWASTVMDGETNGAAVGVVVRDDRLGTRGASGVPTTLVQWRFGETMAELLSRPVDEGATVGNWPRRFRRSLTVFAAALELLEQQIVGRTLERVDRATARRNPERSGLVNVVYLRRRLPAAVREGKVAVDWQWRWRVEGHTRALRCDACREARVRCRHPRSARRVVDVHSYTKGPAGKPLKPWSQAVRAVVR